MEKLPKATLTALTELTGGSPHVILGPTFEPHIRKHLQKCVNARLLEPAGPKLWKLSAVGVEALRSYAPTGAPVAPPKMTITSTNLFTLFDAVQKSPDGVIRKVDATEAPHLKRCIAANLLEPTGERGAWGLTPAGTAALREWLDRKENAQRLREWLEKRKS